MNWTLAYHIVGQHWSYDPHASWKNQDLLKTLWRHGVGFNLLRVLLWLFSWRRDFTFTCIRESYCSLNEFWIYSNTMDKIHANFLTNRKNCFPFSFSSLFTYWVNTNLTWIYHLFEPLRIQTFFTFDINQNLGKIL